MAELTAHDSAESERDSADRTITYREAVAEGTLEGSIDRGTASEERLVAMAAGVRHDG